VVHVDGAGSSGDVKLTYQFAQVALDQPAWIKPGAPAASASSATAPSASASAGPAKK
jgi:hypothetical protein